MNKKGTLLISACAIAFIFAILLFYMSAPKSESKDYYLGAKQLPVYDTYFEAEGCLYYLDYSAQLSADKVILSSDPKTDFTTEFSKFLPRFNEVCNQTLDISDFTISTVTSGTDIIYTGKSSKELTFEKEDYVYTIIPYFEVDSTYSGITF